MSEKEKRDIEECEWCNTTGDVEKNKKFYWGTVLLIVFVVVVLYVLSRFIG